MRLMSLAAACACVLLAAGGGWKLVEANVSEDSGTVAIPAGNDLPMLAIPSVAGAEALRIMHDRHEGMEAIGNANKAVHRALAGTPDLATVRTGAAKIAQLSQQASGWFPAGTGPDVGKTGAKPDIWQDPGDFASKLRNFQAAAHAFDAAASSTDVAAINARFADLGGTCKACHDKYRAEMHH